jgi:hypothetical protein
MSRPLLRSTLELSLLFAALVGLIRVRPYDDQPVRSELAAPEGCEMPCFLGIQPGVTTAAEAIGILQQHPWIKQLYLDPDISQRQRPIAMWWQWSGQQPDYVASSSNGMLVSTNDIVAMIAIQTTVPYGDVWTTFNQPSSGTLVLSGRSLTHFAIYSEKRFEVRFLLACPMRSANIWNAPVQLWLTTPEADSYGNYALADWLDHPLC